MVEMWVPGGCKSDLVCSADDGRAASKLQCFNGSVPPSSAPDPRLMVTPARWLAKWLPDPASGFQVAP